MEVDEVKNNVEEVDELEEENKPKFISFDDWLNLFLLK